MKITVKTDEFKKMVAKAIKGAGNNRLLPITSMMLISKNESTDNRICLTTTDTMTWFNVFGEAYTGEPFYCVVPVDIFSKLVSKLTCDKVTLEVIDDVLKAALFTAITAFTVESFNLFAPVSSSIAGENSG